MKQAVMYGGGNIGRGFIGQVLCEAGYELTFVDASQALVDHINRYKQYKVKEAVPRPLCLERGA